MILFYFSDLKKKSLQADYRYKDVLRGNRVMDEAYEKSSSACQNDCNLCLFSCSGIIFWTQSQNRGTSCLLCLEALNVELLLRSAVTPPRVNTGLEVSSTDKNTPTSQQRGIRARIPLSSFSCFRKNVTHITSSLFNLKIHRDLLEIYCQSDRNDVCNTALC